MLIKIYRVNPKLFHTVLLVTTLVNITSAKPEHGTAWASLLSFVV